MHTIRTVCGTMDNPCLQCKNDRVRVENRSGIIIQSNGSTSKLLKVLASVAHWSATLVDNDVFLVFEG